MRRPGPGRRRPCDVAPRRARSRIRDRPGAGRRTPGPGARRRRCGGPRAKCRFRTRSMFLEYTPEQQALRKELREYFAQLLTPDVRAALGEPGEGSPLFRDVVRQMGTDGWLGIGWPQEYGGQGRPATDQFIFFDEAQRAQAPLPFVTLNTVGPTLIEYGTDAQKQMFLPGILSGEIV